MRDEKKRRPVRLRRRQKAAQPLSGGLGRDAMTGGRQDRTDATLGHLLHHFQTTSEGKSGMLMGVHPAGLLEGWGFGDFQSLRSSPDGH